MNKYIQMLMGLAGFVAILWFWSCSGQNGSTESPVPTQAENVYNPSDQPVIEFDTLSHDFGTIIEGEKVVCYFDYRNLGKAPLMLSSVEATCGCTIPDWSYEPLDPGEKESMKIVFDAEGRSGMQLKTITVRSNASNSMIRLTLRANVKNNV